MEKAKPDFPLLLLLLCIKKFRLLLIKYSKLLGVALFQKMTVYILYGEVKAKQKWKQGEYRIKVWGKKERKFSQASTHFLDRKLDLFCKAK